jgi:hypothetical protein
MSWQLTNQHAVCSSDATSFELDPTHPSRFTQISLKNSAATHWDAFAIHPLPDHTMVPEEVYVRDNDLIARFRQSAGDEYAFQLDWRLLGSDGQFAAGVELWLSIQTELLDIRPEIEVACQGPRRHAWKSVSHATLAGELTDSIDSDSPAAFVCEAEDSTGVWMIDPSDQAQTRIVSAPEDSMMRVRFFGQFMEKGVIRRARMRFLVAPGEISTAHLASEYRAFANSPLPLTA